MCLVTRPDLQKNMYYHTDSYDVAYILGSVHIRRIPLQSVGYIEVYVHQVNVRNPNRRS